MKEIKQESFIPEEIIKVTNFFKTKRKKNVLVEGIHGRRK